MAANYKVQRVELNIPGFNEMRNSPEIMAELESLASGIVNQSGLNLDMEVVNRPTRAVATIKVADKKSYYENLKTNELVKLIKGGG